MAEIKRVYAWIGPSNGYAAINWHASSPQYYDWVGLYADENKGTNDYLTYQWVSKSSPYVTSTIIADGLNVRYFTWVGTPTTATPTVSLDEVNALGESVITPASLLASISGERFRLAICRRAILLELLSDSILFNNLSMFSYSKSFSSCRCFELPIQYCSQRLLFRIPMHTARGFQKLLKSVPLQQLLSDQGHPRDHFDEYLFGRPIIAYDFRIKV